MITGGGGTGITAFLGQCRAQSDSGFLVLIGISLSIESLNFCSQIPMVTMCWQQQNRLSRLCESSWLAITRKISF
jgi:hypothetical protein